MRVISTAAFLALLGSAIAFVPQAPKSTQKMDLGKAVQKFFVGPALVLGVYGGPMIQPVHADGSVSSTTVQRASGLYGPRVIALKDAVAKGDFAALDKADGAIRLFNSGAFALNKPQKLKVQALYNDVRAAVVKKDASRLKTSWAMYFKEAGLDKTNPFSLKDAGQSYSGDFDFRRGSPLFDPRVGN